jgi:type II secretory pathway pseudopilin PulG
MTHTQFQSGYRLRRQRRRGLALVELVTSLSILGILAVAMGSSIMLVARSVPASTSSSVGLQQAHDAENLIASELRYALTVTEWTSTAITFTVADRDGNGSPETIRYYWTGASGGPLRRVYNGAEADLIPSAQSFALTYATTTGCLNTVGLRLCIGSEATVHADTTVAVLNRPQVTGP